jgi:hypothetical protein
MIKNDKIDALIILSGNALVVKNLELFKNTDTSDVVRPKSLDRRVQRNINKEHRRKEYGSFYVFAKRCAAAVLIVCTVSFAIAMSIPPVRAAFFNAIVKFFEEYLTIAYISEAPAPEIIEEVRDIKPLDEDWEKDVMLNSNYMYVACYYENGQKVLTHTQIILAKGEMWIDNEHTVLEEVKVGEYSAMLVSHLDKQTFSLSWSDGVYEYLLETFTPEISKEELIVLAETVYQNQ